MERGEEKIHGFYGDFRKHSLLALEIYQRFWKKASIKKQIICTW
jgi:hypothetical protein